MFERYLTDLLTTHFGHVVENLDSDKVRLSAWNGELVLEDLTLRPGALNTFINDCPVEIAYGKVGNLELRLPWTIFGGAGGGGPSTSASSASSFTKGCSVVLTDVNILITPRTETRNKMKSHEINNTSDNSTSSKDSLESRRVRKEKRVQTLLDADLLKRITASSTASNSDQWKWVQDWVGSLLSTLSVTVRNIHIRYEDPGTSMGFEWNYSSNGTEDSHLQHYRPPFAVGVDLGQFSVQTTNPLSKVENRERLEEEKGDRMDDSLQCETSPQQSPKNTPATTERFLISQKVAAAYRLAIYWDSECNLMSMHARSGEKGDTTTRAELCEYYDSAFQVLNGGHNSEFSDESLYRLPHTYILDPISPSVQLSLVSPKPEQEEEDEDLLRQRSSADSSIDDNTTAADSIPTPSTPAITPPSTIAISLPPCKFTISRSTLEDTAYIRKSLSVWQHATKGLLSDGSLLRMARLRPLKPPLEDPKSWWHYACEATLSLQRVSRDGRDLDIEFERRRKRGWVGLAQALGRRRRYVKLYRTLVEGDESEQIKSHAALVEMEDDLLAEEIIAFRIAVYEWMKSQITGKNDAPRSPTKSASRWQGWVSRISNESDAKESVVAGNDKAILTLSHRRRMVNEMSIAVEREKMNIESQYQYQYLERFASLVDIGTFGSVDEDSNLVVWEASLLCQDIAIQVNDQPSETFHHNCAESTTTRSRRLTPVVRLSCAWVQEQSWYQDGSWDTECTLASLSVRDLTGSKHSDGSTARARSFFPNLLGRKRRVITNEKDSVHIDGEEHHRSMTITISRRLNWQIQNGEANFSGVDRGSTTRTQIRILPMEVVYATVPVEALTRVLATVKTPELADDYHRMASVVFEWRERQKNKFLSALAHKHKKIIVDVDVGAPNCLIPEDLSRKDSPMLVVDLGQLRIFKGDVSKQETLEFDDQWRVVLSNIQVQCTSISAYARMPTKSTEIGVGTEDIESAAQQLVEPFSLDFKISTKVVSDAHRGPTDKNRVQVVATLPRLAFNISSSAIRFGRRMEHQWNKRKIEMQASLANPSRPGVFFTQLGSFHSAPISPPKRGANGGSTVPSTTRENGRRSTSARTMQFHFSAPLISFRLENDVDGRDCGVLNNTRRTSHRFVSSTPLVDLSFRGIQGKFVQEILQNGISTTLFDARLHSLGAVDLYQGAGKDYALLLSSVSPGLMTGHLPAGDEYSWQALLEDGFEAEAFAKRGTDLVTVEYTSTTAPDSNLVPNENIADKLSIQFHELYVEWNPETLAAIQRAVRMPLRQEGGFSGEGAVREAEDLSEGSCDDFYDAMEDVFFDAGSENNSAVHLISEISSAQPSQSFDFDSFMVPPIAAEDHQSWDPNRLNMSFSNGELSSPSKVTSPLLYLHRARVTNPEESALQQPYKPFEFIFKLSKLHVDFNKESRHRRVMTAQMDGTTVRFATRPDGGSKTSMSIGNLVFTDPSKEQNQTLYAQILGLQSDGDAKFSAGPSSLLEMEIFINPKTREYATDFDLEKDESFSKGVTIDYEKGVVHGCNTFIRATFSPMRFVFLEQLWFEFLDYFFEGIIGSAVWGGGGGSGLGPSSSAADTERALLPTFSEFYLPGASAEGVSFTRFMISIESPVVLLPVTYRSTEFVRVEMASISVCNRYDSSVVSDNEFSFHDLESEERRQWYNNCEVVLQDLTIFSWCGRELVNKAVVATISAMWPVGPLAYLIVPKWDIDCQMDSLDISLRRIDYAVLQNILSYNIGEASRHLDEWEALQNLSQDEVEQYKETIMVHFGYDNKDVQPTTYNVTVAIPSVSFSLIEGGSAIEKPLAIASCTDLHWQLRKLADRATRQRVTCDVDVVTPNTSGAYDRLLSLSQYDSEVLVDNKSSEERDETATGLTYTSETNIKADHIKTLEICDACIYMVVPAWKRFASFFQSLPEPHILSVRDVGGSIQVGDRWYRIGGNSDSQTETDDAVDKTKRRLSWIGSNFAPTSAKMNRLRSHGSIKLSSPSFQLRVLLTSPRIILSSKSVDTEEMSRLILRMRHLDYLHTNDGNFRSVKRAFFFDGVEVYSRSASKGSQQGENSLIHPWCFAGTMERCNGESIGNCECHSVRISADVLHARAAYSDMLIAIEVCLSVFQDTRTSDSPESVRLSTSPSSPGSVKEVAGKDSGTASPSDSWFCRFPLKNLYDIECDGFELLVVDDSGRHFAGAQDMIILSLGKIAYSLEECHHEPVHDISKAANGLKTTAMNLRLHSLDLFDCLQPAKSPFRLAASSRSGAMGLQTVRHSGPFSEDSSSIIIPAQKRRMSWSDFIMVKDESWGYSASQVLLIRCRLRHPEMLNTSQRSNAVDEGVDSTVIPELIEVQSLTRGGVSSEFHLKLRSLAVQWNPSTIIAIQRFLGRLRKDSKTRAVRVFNQEIDDLISPPSLDESDGEQSIIEQHAEVEPSMSVHAVVDLGSLTVCLNKEHQQRRLVEATLSGCRVELESSDMGISVDGKLGDFNAWDSDNYEKASSGEELILRQNRSILKVASFGPEMSREASTASASSGGQPFLEVHYKTFKAKEHHSFVLGDEVPLWVQSQVSGSHDIDDYLSLSVASLQVTYIRERTDEILDYLSNGLPGKGMGATSRAAKGFLKKRILSKSFFEFHVNSPQVVVPQHEISDNGIVLKLGDVNVKSWFEKATEQDHQKPYHRSDEEQDEWWRILSLSLTGFLGGVYKHEDTRAFKFSPSTKPIDLDIVLRKPTVRGRDIGLRGKLSFVDMTMNYNDYVLLRAIVRDNVGRKVDTEKWDNVEKAYWMEEATMEDGPAEGQADGRVAYSSHARFIRYGARGRSKASGGDVATATGDVGNGHAGAVSSNSSTLDLRFELDGLALKLRRDDRVEGVSVGDDMSSAFHYDVMLLRVQVVEVSVSTNSSGDVSFHLSLFRIGLFDLGDHGRLLRERYLACLPGASGKEVKGARKAIRTPCPFSVLAEGYSPGDQEGKSSNDDSKNGDSGPQLVVTMDRCPASSAGAIGSLGECSLPKDSKVTIARIVINFLSVNALIRPYQEIAAFLSCAWPTDIGRPRPTRCIEKGTESIGGKPEDIERTERPKSTSSCFQLKLVAHYPRVFFLADESDAHSRALVVRGLAVVNASNIVAVSDEEGAESQNEGLLFLREDVQRFTTVDAQLHRMETYINPDVDNALRFKRRHAEMVGDISSPLSSSIFYEDTDEGEGVAEDALGVALIQPVTTGVEYSEVQRARFPTQRSLFVNIEPVSTMLSFEDLQLIEAVLKRWSSKRSAGASKKLDQATESPTAKNNRDTVDLYQSGSNPPTYDIVFRSSRLGLGLKMEGNCVVVGSIESDDHQGSIKAGDVMLGIDGAKLEAKSLADVVRQLSLAKRPTLITFASSPQRTAATSTSIFRSGASEVLKNDPGLSNLAGPTATSPVLAMNDTGLVDCYTVWFRTSVPVGLKLEKCACGNFPVVSKILPTIVAATTLSSFDGSDSNQFEVVNQECDSDRLPRAGAIIVAVDGKPTEGLRYEEVMGVLEGLCGDLEDESVAAVADATHAKEVYSLSFLEVDSSLWGTNDSVDIAAAGITLSFIDDLMGRDMPLFRGKVSSVEIHAGRGLGVETSILDTTPPPFLKFYGDYPNKNANGANIGHGDGLERFHSDPVLTCSAIAMSAIDYYHPRIAVWEPFLEPSQLFLQLEKQDGSFDGARPAQLAVEISDRLLRDQNFRRNLPTQMSEPQMVSLNLTDAAAEVFVKALNQWKEWRKSVGQMLPSGDDHNLFTGQDSFSNQEASSVTAIEQGARVTGDSGNLSAIAGKDLSDRKQEVKQLEAQKAAQAALVFAQKRGAETNKKGETAKPFVFRNRTGVSVAFAQQKLGNAGRQNSRRSGLRRNLSVVGEYAGLAWYDPVCITELADQEDAKFDMEMLSDAGIDGDGSEDPLAGTKHTGNKVRNYEGRFPCLLVAIQAVAGVSVEPIEDLQVYKVGSSVRHLSVRKEVDRKNGSRDSTTYSVPVVWKVEIEDNRRILTLSSAVRVLSTGFNTPIDVGVQKDRYRGDARSESAIRSIGVSRPESPFYLPLWLALKLEAVSVFVRPRATRSPPYSWGRSSVLEFSPVISDDPNTDAKTSSADLGKWAWKETFRGPVSIPCESPSNDFLTVWLSCFDTAQTTTASRTHKRRRHVMGKTGLAATDPQEQSNEVISVTVDSGLTLRNMLPMHIEWEVAHSENTGEPLIVDGSLMRQDNVAQQGFLPGFKFDDDISRGPVALKSGDCTEVFPCNYKHESLKLRFRELRESRWSNWASLSLPLSTYHRDGADDEEMDSTAEKVHYTTARQVNVQAANDDFGAPLTFGVRIVPKTTQAMLDDDISLSHVYGMEVIVFAELWIRNLTALPLNFGCPAYQMHESFNNPSGTHGESELLAARFTAESALMEIASVLEFGDKGTGLSSKAAREVAASGGIQSLPNQECSQIVEEVFEYVEMENSAIKRRWWASESYDSYRENITESPNDSPTWRWIDESWSIDCSGQAQASSDGWESCRNLLGAGSFSVKREFDPSHAFRRRRWIRARATDQSSQLDSTRNTSLLGGLQAFHQPLKDAFSREQRKLEKKKKGKRRKRTQEEDTKKDTKNEVLMKVAIKNGDGRWSLPISLPPTGTCHGVIRVLASRWPGLTNSTRVAEEHDLSSKKAVLTSRKNGSLQSKFDKACLSPALYELCHTVSDVDGDWGEFSRSMIVYPRFLVRNDSKTISIEVKQAGSPDRHAVMLAPGESRPFYWADFRLPGLASVRPSLQSDSGQRFYRWSGGFDVCNLGMCPIRVRGDPSLTNGQPENQSLRSIRALVEIRPGTGGSGINLSFREEDPRGYGSLFRIENFSTFPIWLAQDGVLANPSSTTFDPLDRAKGIGDAIAGNASQHGYGWKGGNGELQGDLVPPMGRMSYSLDVPYRQGKYTGRKAATMPELLRVRAALAPLASRDGIESVKVIGLTNVGDCIRLNPSKLVITLSTKMRSDLQRVRILGVVTTDGPTRVLKFCLMENEKSDIVFGNPFGDVSYISSKPSMSFGGETPSVKSDDFPATVAAAVATLEKMKLGSLPSEGDAKRAAFFGPGDGKRPSDGKPDRLEKPASPQTDQIYSLRAEFSGFIVSVVDSAPSEVAVMCLKNFNALASWNKLLTKDASAILSIGRLQVDNHVPNAPFPVAIRPDDPRPESLDDDDGSVGSEKLEEGVLSAPLLMIGLAFAPKHQSGIVCLRSVTVAPRNIVIALDLAFLVRLQKYVVGILGHFQSRQHDSGGIRHGAALISAEQKRAIQFPDLESQAKDMERAAEFGVENQKLYFERLSILPCNINLSVAPARALTPAQASLEGKETAAIHEAVRKGNVFVGSSSALLGVKVGRKNTTALAVVRGVFKSIVVDALLRLDGASLNFSGVFLRNHISTAPQLTTYLLAHYLASLRHNVPALLGSLAAFGNPLGLIRGLGDGVSDFVTEPVKGLKKSVKELDPFFLVDGVARGTESLARHTVGGFADSASLLTETFSKNMAVLTLDRRYAQKRDRDKSLRRQGDVNVTLAGGVESGFAKLLQGFSDGVTGVVKAPMRGAEKRGIEGFAKGVGKGLLGLLVKPMIGISDAATEVLTSVVSSVETTGGLQDTSGVRHYRPRRPMYGRDKVLRPYNLEDAAAATLMLRTRNGGENYLSHIDLGDRVALLSVRRLLLLGPNGQELLALKFKHVASIEVRSIQQEDGSNGWGIVIILNTPRRNGSEVEVISCNSRAQAIELCAHTKRGMDVVAND